jgi:hypothetical protein
MQSDGRTEMTKLIFASHNLAKAPKKQEIEFAFGVGPRREIHFFPFSFCKSFIYHLHGECIWCWGKDFIGLAAVSIWWIDGPIPEHLTHLLLPVLFKAIRYSQIHPP